MRSRLMLVLVAGTILVIAAAAYQVYHSHDEEIRVEAGTKALALIREIQARFPVGSARADVVTFLQHRATGRGFDHSRSQGVTGYWVEVGRAPSQRWYCGQADVGVYVTFVQDRLVKAEPDVWDLNCP